MNHIPYDLKNPYDFDVRLPDDNRKEVFEEGINAILDAQKKDAEYGELHGGRFMDLMTRHGWHLGNLPTGWLHFIKEKDAEGV